MNWDGQNLSFLFQQLPGWVSSLERHGLCPGDLSFKICLWHQDTCKGRLLISLGSLLNTPPCLIFFFFLSFEMPIFSFRFGEQFGRWSIWGLYSWLKISFPVLLLLWEIVWYKYESGAEGCVELNGSCLSLLSAAVTEFLRLVSLWRIEVYLGHSPGSWEVQECGPGIWRGHIIPLEKGRQV